MYVVGIGRTILPPNEDSPGVMSPVGFVGSRFQQEQHLHIDQGAHYELPWVGREDALATAGLHRASGSEVGLFRGS